MSITSLNLNEMGQLSQHWTDPKGARPALERYPLLAAMLPELESARDDLRACQRSVGSPELAKELSAIKRRLGDELDPTHDALVRGLDCRLDAEVYAAASEEEAEGYRALKARLLSQGVSIIQGSYLAESGHADKLGRDLADDAAFGEALAAIPFAGKRTALTVARKLVQVGREIGALEHRKNALQSTIRAASGEAETVGVLEARNAWVRSATMLRNSIDFLKSVSPDDRRALLSSLETAERRADARVRDVAAAPVTPPANG